MDEQRHRIRLDAQWVLKPVVRFSMRESESVSAPEFESAKSFQELAQHWQWGERTKLKHLRELGRACESLNVEEDGDDAEQPQGILLERFFNRPTGLDDGQSVVLAFESTSDIQVWMNDRPLDLKAKELQTPGEQAITSALISVQIEINDCLEKRNQLQVVFVATESQRLEDLKQPLIQSVMLEIAD